MNTQRTTVASFDLLRVVSCFMVIILHTAASNFYIFDQYWWASNFYDSLVRCSVPLFFMISGSLLLTSQDDIFLFYRKRAVRIVPPLIFWSLVYMIWQAYHGLTYGSILGWIKTMCKGPVIFHLWYLYAMVGLYVFIPFLRKIYLHADIKERIIFLLLWLSCSAVIPFLTTLFDIKMNIVAAYNMQYFAGFIGYLFAGAFLYDMNQKYNTDKYSVVNMTGYFFASACTMLLTYLYSKKTGGPTELFYGYLSLFVALSAIFFYSAIYKIGLL